MIRPLLIVLGACAVVTSASAAQPQAIAPGLWETTNQVVSPMHSSKTEKRCIKASDVAKFMEGPSNHIYRCTYPTRLIHDGTIRLSGSCKSRDQAPFPIQGQGTFTRDSFHLEAVAQAPFGPLKVPVRAITDAKRVSASCPAPSAAKSEEKPAVDDKAADVSGAAPPPADDTH